MQTTTKTKPGFYVFRIGGHKVLIRNWCNATDKEIVGALTKQVARLLDEECNGSATLPTTRIFPNGS